MGQCDVDIDRCLVADWLSLWGARESLGRSEVSSRSKKYEPLPHQMEHGGSSSAGNAHSCAGSSGSLGGGGGQGPAGGGTRVEEHEQKHE